MGMESCYVNLICESCHSDVDSLVDHLRQRYSINKCRVPVGLFHKKQIAFNGKFTVDNKAILTADRSQTSDELDVTLEWCLCNFENNLTYVYDLLKRIDEFLGKTELLIHRESYVFTDMNFVEYKSLVTHAFSEKLILFEARYGQNNIDILPYKFYGWYGRRHFFNIFRM